MGNSQKGIFQRAVTLSAILFFYISHVLTNSPVYVLNTIDLLEWWFPPVSSVFVKLYNLLATYFSEMRHIKPNPWGAAESTAGLRQPPRWRVAQKTLSSPFQPRSNIFACINH